MKADAILTATDLRAEFHTRRGIVRAVNGVSFSLRRGETLGIVGESGSGKSVTHLSYLGLLPSPPLKIAGGSVRFQGLDLLTATEKQLRAVRGNKISMIFQEPMTSLNPYLRISTQLIEPLRIHGKLSKKAALVEAERALERVGIPTPKSALRAYPHEFSGGMRQRVMIAMALTTNPEVLIADEPTTALDVTVQAQILELLKSIQKERGMAIVLITHDLGVVAGLADKILVMYAGRAFEEGTSDQIFYQSVHPYTRALLRSTPRLDVDQQKLPTIAGAPPDLTKLGDGCPFVDRCEHRMEVCVAHFPLVRVPEPGHESFCHWEAK